MSANEHHGGFNYRPRRNCIRQTRFPDDIIKKKKNDERRGSVYTRTYNSDPLNR